MSVTLRGSERGWSAGGAAVRGVIAGARTLAVRGILTNAASLGGTTLVTAGLGYLYWILAARQLPASSVGFAGAAISAMTLLGTAGTVGLGTLLIGELPKLPGSERSLVLLGVAIAGLAGTTLGTVFALLAPALSPDLGPLGTNVGVASLFGLGVGLTSVTIVLDQALVGLARGMLQLVRNALFAAAKLGALVLACAWIVGADGMTIYCSWILGNVLSLVGLGIILGRTRRRAVVDRPQMEGSPRRSLWANGRLRVLGRAALSHHALNLALQAPYLMLPLVATTFLSATVNAYFYIAWVLAGFVYVGPGHLATALYAATARSPATLTQKVRFTLGLSLAVSVGAIVVIFATAGLVLGLFGEAYAEKAAWSLRVLALWTIPLIVKDHYVVLCRLHDRAGTAALVVGAAGLFEIVMASIGATIDGLYGLSIGWLIAGWLQAIVMLPTVYRAAIGWSRSSRAEGGRSADTRTSEAAL